ncbi:MAG TPA: hypothetical protein VMP42_06570, partial [Actinomycetota bacterium]|nr:hypothetical protein [Actinomycetota bacterium]
AAFVAAVTVLVLVAGALAPAVALAAKKPLHGIPLVWKPTDEIGELGTVDLTGLSGVTVRVQPFTDSRDEPAKIGANVEDADEGKTLEVTTSDEVGPWLADRFAWAIDQFGIDTTDEGGTVVLEGEVKRFFVTEAHTYDSDVGVRVSLKTPDGTVLWEGLANGSSTRFGRSYKAENYNEVLSDAVLQAAFDLLKNESFRRALAGR